MSNPQTAPAAPALVGAAGVTSALAPAHRRPACQPLGAAGRAARAAADRENYQFLRDQGLTIAQAAERLGVTRRTADRYEARLRQDVSA